MQQRNHGWNVFLRGSAVFLCLLAASCGRQELDTLRFEDEQVLYGQTARIQGFDPAKSGDVSSSLAIGKMYEGLLEYSYLERPYKVEPLLAEAMPEVSEDGLTYTFKIRDGIFFQDDSCFPGGKGRELVAEDFVYSIKRIADIKNASSGYWAFNGRLVGLDEFRSSTAGTEPTDYDAPVEGLRALDDRTLQIQLTGPYPQLLWILAMHYSFAVPREAVEMYGDDFVNHPVGTGPFCLSKWTRNYRIEFIRNPKWVETGRVELYPSEGTEKDRELGLLNDAGKPVPFLDRIVQYVVDDPATQWMMFLSGHFSFSGISRDNWDVVIKEDSGLDEKLAEQKIRLLASPTLDLYYIGFNMDDPVVGKNKKLRQALSCAFNSAEWVRLSNGQGLAIYGPVPVPLVGSRAAPGAYAFNLEKARRLLVEAGYPDGIDPKTGRRLELRLDSSEGGSPGGRQSNELICSFMDMIGVKLTMNYSNRPLFFKRVQAGETQMFRLSWIADYPDAQNFLQVFYGPNAHASNRAAYINPEYDRMYEMFCVLPPSPERNRLCERMINLIMEDCPWIFMHQPLDFVVTRHWLKNYNLHAFPYSMSKYYRVDQLEWTACRSED